MATSSTVRISLENYLASTYKPDREWIEGEVRERHMGKFEHARLQALLASWLIQNEDRWQIQVATEARVRVAPQRVRVPDLVAVPPGKQPPVLNQPPLLVIEILSPDDTYAELQERAQDYRSMGVLSIWIIDPKTRTGRMCLSAADGADAWVLASVLKVPDSDVYVDLNPLFAKLTPRS